MAEYYTKDGDNFVEVKELLHTQEDLDRVLRNRLEKERTKFADYDDLKTKAETLSKQVEEKQKAFETEKSELQKKLEKASLETEKVKVVHEFKLSEDLAEFVTGDTAEDMRKRAEKLAKGIKPGEVDLDKKNKPEGKASSSKEIAGKLFGNKSDD